MNVALAFLMACALTGLFFTLENRRAYLVSLIGAAVVAALSYNFGGLR